MTTDLTDLRNLQLDNLQFTIYVQFSNLSIYISISRLFPSPTGEGWGEAENGKFRVER